MSAQSIPILSLTRRLTGAVSACRFVTLAGAQAAAGASTLGVARSNGAAGDLITVDILGSAVVEAGGVIAANATVGVDANGCAVTYASGAKVGVALDAAASAGQLIEVLLVQNVA